MALLPTAETPPVPDFSRHRRYPLLALVIGTVCLSILPAEATVRAHVKTGRLAVKAPAARLSKGAHTNIPAIEAKSLEAKSAELEAAPAATSGVWTAGEQERACLRGRRKLWQPGEGWVVKKVNLCP